MTSIPTGIDLARFVARRRGGRARAARPARRGRRSASSPRCATGRATATCSRRSRADRAAWRDWQVLVVGDGPYRDRLDAQARGARPRRPTSASSASRTTSCRGCRRSTCSRCRRTARKACRRRSCRRWPAASRWCRRRSGAIAEAVDDGVTGLLVAPRSAPALAAGLARAARRPGAARALRCRGARAGRARLRPRPRCSTAWKRCSAPCWTAR